MTSYEDDSLAAQQDAERAFSLYNERVDSLAKSIRPAPSTGSRVKINLLTGQMIESDELNDSWEIWSDQPLSSGHILRFEILYLPHKFYGEHRSQIIDGVLYTFRYGRDTHPGWYVLSVGPVPK